MVCDQCGESVTQNMAEDCVITCGRCVQRRLNRDERMLQERLGGVDAQKCIDKRKAKGWTQRELAHRIGTTIRAVAEFERGLTICPSEVARWMGVLR